MIRNRGKFLSRLVVLILPVVFIANRGQTDAQVGFRVRGATHEPTHAPLSATTQSLPTGEFPITTNPANQYDPAISGDIVVWADNRNGNTDIYAYDLSTQRELRITNDTAKPSTLDIGDRIVVWYDWRADNQGVYGYDLSTEREFLISIHSFGLHAGPTISGDIVVWVATSTAISVRDIRGFDLSTQSSFVITDVWWGYSFNPDIFGNIIVWENGLSNPTRRDIHGFDLLTQTDFSITNDYGNTNQMNPAIWNNTVVWQDNRHGNWDIYGYDLSSQTEFRITDDPADQVSPTVSGQTVLWQDARNGSWDLYGYDLDRQIEFPVRTLPADQLSPAIADNVIVWEDRRNRNGDLYAQQFEYPVLALRVEPQLLFFDVNDSAIEPPVQEIEISAVGDDSIEWTASPEADWLTIAPVSGTTPTIINVSINASNLHGGSYPWQIIVAGSDSRILNTPQSVVVDFLGTEISGTIDADTTWTVAGSPYIVAGDVTVSESVVLTIEPGAGLRFESNDALSSGVNPDKAELIVAGTLVADGVTFTSNADFPAAGDWYGIRFLDSSVDYGDSGCIIKNSTIEYGTVGISIDGASPMISNNVIVQMKGADGETPEGMSEDYPNQTDGKDGYGIHMANYSEATITKNTIANIFGGTGVSGCMMGGCPGIGGRAVGIHIESSSPTMSQNLIANIAGGPGEPKRGGGHGVGIYLDASWSTVDNNDISIVAGGAGGYRSVVHDGVYGIGIWASNGSSLTIANNTISNIRGSDGANAGYAGHGYTAPGGDGGTGAGIYATGGSSLNTANNIIHQIHAGDGGAGLDTTPGGDGGTAAGIYAADSSAVLANDTIVASTGGQGGSPGGADGDGVGIDVDASSTVSIIINNIIVSHTIGISSTTTTATLSHNDVWGNSDANYSGVAPGSNDISANPLFVDPANNDYHLQCDSPAIDAGTNESAPPTDFEGDPRPLDGNSDGMAVVDMGADEFVRPVPPLFGDFDCDCVVDVVDIMRVAIRWRTRWGDPDFAPIYDIDGDGDIDIVDIMLVVVHWGERCE